VTVLPFSPAGVTGGGAAALRGEPDETRARSTVSSGAFVVGAVGGGRAPVGDLDEMRARSTVSSGSRRVRAAPVGDLDGTRAGSTVSSGSLGADNPRRAAGAGAGSLARMGRQAHDECQRSSGGAPDLAQTPEELIANRAVAS
jgi:hypothetical protein